MDTSPKYFMEQALAEARQAAQLAECPIGAIVVHQGEIIARAHNLVEASQDATQHAEIVALRRASEHLSNWRLTEASLYVTLEPCPMCIGAMLLSRVKQVYFGTYDLRLGAVGSVFDLAQHPGLPHRLEVFPDLLAEESRSLLQDFFQSRR